MLSQLRYGIALLLPTALLLAGFGFVSESLPPQRELFGGDSLYLDVHLPRGRRPNSVTKLPITGYLASALKEERIAGTLSLVQGKWRYEFLSTLGKFSGELVKSPGRCEPELHYRIAGPGPTVETGVLRAGFCKAI